MFTSIRSSRGNAMIEYLPLLGFLTLVAMISMPEVGNSSAKSMQEAADSLSGTPDSGGANNIGDDLLGSNPGDPIGDPSIPLCLTNQEDHNGDTVTDCPEIFLGPYEIVAPEAIDIYTGQQPPT